MPRNEKWELRQTIRMKPVIPFLFSKKSFSVFKTFKVLFSANNADETCNPTSLSFSPKSPSLPDPTFGLNCAARLIADLPSPAHSDASLHPSDEAL